MNLSTITLRQANKENLNFKGVKGEINEYNVPCLEFTIPPHKTGDKVFLEYSYLNLDPKTNEYIFPKQEQIKTKEFKDEKPIQLSQELIQKFTTGLGIRYRIESKDGETRYYLDSSQRIKDNNGNEMNLIEMGSFYGLSPKGGNMYHYFKDSNIYTQTSNVDVKTVKATPRNPYNLYGGTTKDLINILDYTDILNSYSYVMTNPDIGNDKISSHKYWPENQYQCSNMDDFKELNFKLFQKGKGYVADGAFTSMGINSPMVQHVFKWGDKSPFYNMLKINGKLQPGVIPERKIGAKKDIYDDIGIRLVNHPKNSNYDKSKPTYIQFFDRRLLSQKKQDDSKNLIFTYDKEPDDHYEIIDANSSVYPYAFEIDPKDPKTKEKIKNAFKDGSNKVFLSEIKNLDDFLTFENGKIVTKSKAGGATFWDGSVDLIKLNLSNPTNDPKNIEGCKNARNYITNAAAFWTETIQREHIHKTPLLSDKEKQEVAKNNRISAQEYENIKEAIDNDDADSFILDQDLKVEDYVDSFPLQSIETSSELSAVFSQVEFQNEFNKKGGSAYQQLSSIVNSVIDEVIPDEYKDNEEYRTFVVKSYAPDIIKSVIVGAIDSNLLDDNGKPILSKLKNVNIKTFEGLIPITSPEEERESVLKGILAGISPQNGDKIKQSIKKDLNKIKLEDFKLAESIVLKSKAGLNWRFDAAKDVGDIDAVKNGDATFDQIWNGSDKDEGVQAFWGDFISNIRRYNPASTVINELTDMGDSIYKWKDLDSIRDYDAKFFEKVKNMTKEELDNWNEYREHPPVVIEKRYLGKTNSTTTSMFEYFNNLSELFGVNPETGANYPSKCGNLEDLMQIVKKSMNVSQPNNFIYAHFFTHNHDKPFPLHCFPLDTKLFLTEDLSNANVYYKQIAKDVTGRDDYENISAKAVATAHFLKQAVDKSELLGDDDKIKVKHAITNLANGKIKDSDEPDFDRADVFGATAFKYSLQDALNYANVDTVSGIELEQEALKASKERFNSIVEIAHSLPGVFTVLNGTEYAETGYETKSKNVYCTNRNRVLSELRENDLFKADRKFYEINCALHMKKDLSALRGGFCDILKTYKEEMLARDYSIEKVNPKNFDKFSKKIADFIQITFKYQDSNQTDGLNVKIMFESLDDKRNNHPEEYRSLVKEMFGLDDAEFEQFDKEFNALKTYYTKADKYTLNLAPSYFYDEKGSRVVSIATNNGMMTSKEVEKSDGKKINIPVEMKKTKISLDCIPIKSDDNIAPLEDGTILKRKIYNSDKTYYLDDKSRYVVYKGSIYKESAIPKIQKGYPLDNADKISFDNNNLIFYAPHSENPQYMSYLYNQAS